MKILSWNVASLRTLPAVTSFSSLSFDINAAFKTEGEQKLAVQYKTTAEKGLEAFFTAQEADIIAIQEHKFGEISKVAPDCLQVDGYDSFWSFAPKQGYAGVVTFVKKGLTKSATDDPFSAIDSAEDPKLGEEIQGGRLVLTEHCDFLLLNVYAVNGGRGPQYVEQKMQFYAKLQKAVHYWQTVLKKNVIIAGDITPAHTELDQYNPKKFSDSSGFLPIERDWITTFLEEEKMKDAWRYLHPHERRYTFWDAKRRTFLSHHFCFTSFSRICVA